MDHSLDASIVRIFGEDDSIAGCGFLVSSRHVVTCAHVIAYALGIDRGATEMPAATIRLDFPLLDSNAIYPARVVFWKPVGSSSSSRPDRLEDIAALELHGELPDGSNPAPIVVSAELWDHSFHSFGFPLEHDNGVWATGIIRAGQANGWVQIEDVKNTGYFVEPGFSGTPVWDDDVSGVVGMVVVAERRSEVRAGSMIPTRILAEAWPPLEVEIARAKTVAASSERKKIERRNRVGGKRPKLESHFKGRLPEQKTLGEYLARPSARVVSVTGRAGIGKTALASKVLNDLERGRWPHTGDDLPVDGIVYMSPRSLNGISLAQLFLDCGEMLGDEHKQSLVDISNSDRKAEAKIQLLLEKLEGGRYIILLDHVDVLLEEGSFRDEELQTFFESSLESANGLRLVVTSRDPLTFPSDSLSSDLEVPLLEGLPVSDGVAVLRDLDPGGKSRLRDADEKELASAVERLHGVPRALEVLAGIMRKKQLAQLGRMLDEFYQQPEIDDLIKEGYKMLDSNEREVMKRLAVFGCPVPHSAVSYMLQPSLPDIDAVDVLERLLGSYLAKASSDGQTVWLDPIDQDYAYRKLLPHEGDRARIDLELRAAEYFRNQRKPKESWRTIQDVGPHLREFEHRIRAQDYVGAAETLSQVDSDFLIWYGHARRALELRTMLDGRLTDSRSLMFHAYAIGNIRQILGPYNEAIGLFEYARKIAGEIGDREMEFRITGALGGTYRRLGQPKKAIENYEQTQEIAREFNDLRLESEYLLSYGLACTYSGDLKAGVAHANRLLEISTEAGEVKFEAQAYDCYSLVYLAAGRLDETIEYCDKSMRIYESENNRNGAMYVLNVRGMAEVGKNQLTEAIRTLEQARKMASDEDYPRLEGFCLFNLACAYRKLGEMDKALEAATKAREILAKLQAAESEPAKMLADSIRAANEGRRLDEARSLLDCSRCSITTPDIYDSDYFAEQAREIAQSEGSPELVAQADELIERKLQALILPD